MWLNQMYHLDLVCVNQVQVASFVDVGVFGVQSKASMTLWPRQQLIKVLTQQGVNIFRNKAKPKC